MDYFLEISQIILISKFLISSLFGSMLFFSIIIAPTVFQSLDTINSRIFIRNLFPKLYMWGIIISLINCLLLINVSLIGLKIGIPILLGFLFSRQVLVKRINDESDKSTTGQNFSKKFKTLHSLSVLIFVIQLLLMLTYITVIN